MKVEKAGEKEELKEKVALAYSRAADCAREYDAALKRSSGVASLLLVFSALWHVLRWH